MPRRNERFWARTVEAFTPADLRPIQTQQAGPSSSPEGAPPSAACGALAAADLSRLRGVGFCQPQPLVIAALADGQAVALAHRQAGYGLEDAVDLLDLFDDDRSDSGHVGRLDRGDHVIFPGDGVGQFDALDALKRPGHLDGLSR